MYLSVLLLVVYVHKRKSFGNCPKSAAKRCTEYHPKFNTGFMIIKSTPNSIQLFRNWEQQLKTTHLREPVVFSHLVKTSNIEIGALNCHQFPRRLTYPLHGDEVIVHHNASHENKKDKIELFKRLGLWSLKL